MDQHFTSPPHLREYYAQVWAMVRMIPPGKVATYGQIAALIPPPGGMDPKSYNAFAPRWVGGAMANCPGEVPWQRVVNSQGKISLGRGSGANDQKELLEAEGVQFDSRDRIDLKTYRWPGPDTGTVHGAA
jgi:methylated-DNA-protein-cysteine methyltransferase related protein